MDKLTTDDTTKTFIIRQPVLHTLSPGEQEFLLIHGKETENIEGGSIISRL